MRAEDLLGTWRLVALEHRVGDEVSYPMGRDAVGCIAYDGSGRMSVQIMRRDRPPLGTGGLRDATAEELRAALEGYLAYCGSYRVDEVQGTVIHHIDCHLLPAAVGTELRRLAELQGNRLTLHAAPVTVGGRQQTTRIVWERVNSCRIGA